ncbi:hypothetical protein [Bacillus safensis]|uniref:hypothetical protein n=1 Tax=Bacillus safensis TaxID=561879 RepID=UPI002452BB17|nr:hypothetical protein [Bacillus safensis]MDH3097594.1 hypothetical protein [Bacillus safensis]
MSLPTSQIELTREQAEALEARVKFYEAIWIKRGARLNNMFALEHWLIKKGEERPWELIYEPLNDIDLHDLMSALTNGYVVKEEQ